MINTREKNQTTPEQLGQVFTSRKVAKLMVKLVRPFINPRVSCLDPCIGKNVFFLELQKKGCKKFVGVELDACLVDPKSKDFFKKKNRRLIIGDFFKFNQDEKFDIIIMNPPYVRQELLNQSMNSKDTISKSLGDEFFQIPKKSNLYIYFLIKSLKHLKKDGVLIAIIYDSWLFTDYGQIFKEYIVKNHSLEKIVHFRNGAFEKVNVGATIVILRNKPQKPQIDYYLFNSPSQLGPSGALPHAKLTKIDLNKLFNFHLVYGNSIDFTAGIFVPISSISDFPPNRGISPLVNKFFLFKKDEFKPYTQKIIKSVSGIKKFEVQDDYEYLLKIPKEISDKAISDYILRITSEIKKSPGTYKSAYRKMEKDPYWFVIKGHSTGNVIFNYYMRNNLHFIYNPNRYLVADNFYNLYVNENLYQNLCILNSIITTFALLKFGKSQGRGLFKIQLNKFKNIPIIDTNKLSKETSQKLVIIGKELLDTNRKHSEALLLEIDNLLITELNLFQKNPVTRQQLLDEINKIRGADF